MRLTLVVLAALAAYTAADYGLADKSEYIFFDKVLVYKSIYTTSLQLCKVVYASKSFNTCFVSLTIFQNYSCRMHTTGVSLGTGRIWYYCRPF